MAWNGLIDYVKAVYMAQVLGIIDPRLEPTEPDGCCFTQEELDRMEELVDELLAAVE